MSLPDQSVVFGTEDLLMSLCNSVARTLRSHAKPGCTIPAWCSASPKPASNPTLAALCCFDGGFSNLVIINFSASAAMELYQSYLLSMGMSKEDLVFVHV